jgi:hypothetical protein
MATFFQIVLRRFQASATGPIPVPLPLECRLTHCLYCFKPEPCRLHHSGKAYTRFFVTSQCPEPLAHLGECVGGDAAPVSSQYPDPTATGGKSFPMEYAQQLQSSQHPGHCCLFSPGTHCVPYPARDNWITGRKIFAKPTGSSHRSRTRLHTPSGCDRFTVVSIVSSHRPRTRLHTQSDLPRRCVVSPSGP